VEGRNTKESVEKDEGRMEKKYEEKLKEKR